jgi:hypothetical protein
MVDKQGWGNAEGDQIGQGIVFDAETAACSCESGNLAIQLIEDNSDQNSDSPVKGPSLEGSNDG